MYVHDISLTNNKTYANIKDVNLKQKHMLEFDPRNQTDWSYTQHFKRGDPMDTDAKKRILTGNRHTIGRDTSVLNGVYTGNYGGEAIVVDYDREKSYYDALADTVLERAVKSDGSIDKSLVMDAVFDVVSELMAYSQDGVQAVNDVHDIKDHRKVSLALYVEAGVGVCRHQALMVTTLFEILKNRGIIRGTASIDRNIQWPEGGDPAGHAWVRYTNGSGEVFIIDVAQKFIGTLEESKTQTRGWNYLRPGEIAEESPKVLMEVGSVASSGLITGIPEHLK